MTDALIYIARLVDRKFQEVHLYAFRASSFDEAACLACEEAARSHLELGHLEVCADQQRVILDADRADEWGFDVRQRRLAPTHQPARQVGFASMSRAPSRADSHRSTERAQGAPAARRFG